MLETIQAIGGICGIIAFISILYVTFTKLGRMEMKLCTLWKVYGEGVLERAVREGFAHHSAIVITDKGEDLLGNTLKQKIMDIIERKGHKKVMFIKTKKYDEDLKYLVIDEMMGDIKKAAYEKDIDFDLLVSAAMLYTEKKTREGKC